MQRGKRPREYRGNSCLRCHKQKVKCSRDNPCRSCNAANKPCVYVVRDRTVTVAESYLKRLEAAASEKSSHSHNVQPSGAPSSAGRSSEHATSTSPAASRPLLSNPHVENSTAARFVSQLKEIQNPKTADAELASVAYGDGSSTQPPVYEYFTLNSDTSHAKYTFKLPPYPYALFLVNQFLIYIGHDWHWFRLRRFQQRLVNVYTMTDSAESKDRIWLCQLLVAFALGSTISGSISGRDPQTCFLSPEQAPGLPGQGYVPPAPAHIIPGVEFFEQALGLLKIAYEEVSLEHVETLNMMALCSYCLNRQKTAYMYAGVSARMCNMLQLHETSASRDCSPVERENRKRVWWSTFCIDRMASTQMGVLPTLQSDQGDLSYPSSDGLAANDMDEFSDPDFLTARIQLTIIQAAAVNDHGHEPESERNVEIDTLLHPKLQRLQAWKDGLPVHMAVPFHAGMAETVDNMALLRSLANLHLRYNHCVILLLRPLLLRQISSIVSNEECDAAMHTGSDLQDLNRVCLEAARSSLHMLNDLRTCKLLARLGFMENMHLLSSLIILCLAKVINARRPHSFHADPHDDAAYEAGKDVLQDMEQAGSLAARGHVSMLNEVEAHARSIAMGETTAGANVRSEPWDADDWMAQIFDNENWADFFSFH